MRIRYTTEAHLDLLSAIDHVLPENPSAASHLAERLLVTIERLAAGDFEGPETMLTTGEVVRSWPLAWWAAIGLHAKVGGSGVDRAMARLREVLSKAAPDGPPPSELAEAHLPGGSPSEGSAMGVQATKNESFSAVELTVDEWTAAREHGDSYWLALVTSCLDEEQTVRIVEKPADLPADVAGYRLNVGLPDESSE